MPLNNWQPLLFKLSEVLDLLNSPQVQRNVVAVVDIVASMEENTSPTIPDVNTRLYIDQS